MVVPADDVGDPHVDVVNGDAEIIGRGAVRADDHHVVELIVLKGDGSGQEVFHHGLALVRRAEAKAKRLGRVRVVAAPAAAVVLGRFPLGARLLAHLLDFIGGAGAAVGRSRLEHPARRPGVHLHPLGLAVGPLVPVEAEPFERLEDCTVVLFGRALPVGVLDAEDGRPARVACEKPVEKGGSRSPDMKVPCVRGGETDADGFVHDFSIGSVRHLTGSAGGQPRRGLASHPA